MKDIVKKEIINTEQKNKIQEMKSSIKQRGRPPKLDQNKPDKPNLKHHEKPQIKENTSN